MIREVTKSLKRSNNNLTKQSTRMNLIAGDSHTAFRFGPEVKKLELMILSKNVYKKLAGLKQFWQYNLPTLKFHNSELDMVVTRIRPQQKKDYDLVPCQIKVHLDSETKVMECAYKQHDHILRDLVQLTNAQSVPENEIPHVTVPGHPSA